MALTPMTERYARPAWVRRLNATGAAAGGAEHMVPIDADHCLAHARSSTGLSDFGSFGDGAWEHRFRALVDAIHASDQHVVGRLLTREELLRSLRTRLLMAERWRQDPAIADEVIDAPVIVTGPARSGTTPLFELLGLDDRLRMPVATDVLHPAPPPGTTDAEIVTMTEAEQELWADIQPEFDAVHELRSDLPVECITFTTPSFAGSHWSMLLADLGDWAPDPAADFAFHRAVLQTVQHGKTLKRWLLKTPGYLLMLDELLTAYPDACVILTHRDPGRTMPSTVSTMAMVQWLRTDHIDLDAIAAMVGARFGDALNTVASRRADGTLPGVHGDIRFAQLLRDPVQAIEGVYQALGRTLTNEHRAAIVGYLLDKPRNKHGRRRYRPEDWGFDSDQLRRDLAPYLEQFDVTLEG